MATQRENVRLGLQRKSVGFPDSRLVRKSVEQTTLDVFLSLPRRASVRSGRTAVQVAKSSVLRFSSNYYSGQGSEENTTGTTEVAIADRTVVADEALVPEFDVKYASGEDDPTRSIATSATTLRPQHAGADVPIFGSLVHSFPRLRAAGFSSEVLRQLNASRVSSSNNTYESKWKIFADFGESRGFDPFMATAAQVAEFLVHVASTKKASVSTLAGYRSAIGNILRLTTGYNPGECPILSQLMKSFKRTQPAPSRRIPAWDVSLVLRVLNSEVAQNDSLSIHELTAKTVFLVALASGDRCSALAALKSPVVLSDEGLKVEFDEKFVPKSYFLKKNQSRIKPLIMPRLQNGELQQVCPCRAVFDYVERTKELRDSAQTSLFIPHNPVKKFNIKPQSIARYITHIVAWCYEKEGQACPETRAHDVRKVATSLRELSATSLRDMLEAGNWSTPHMFLKHYKTPFTQTCKENLREFEGITTANSVFSLQPNTV